YHYLSFVRVKNVLGRPGRELELSDSLLERSFQALMSSDTTNLEFGWETSFGQTEEFAYRMSVKSRVTPVLTTRSFEADGVRFTVSNDRITLAGASVRGGGQNILPRNILDWHGVEIYMENPNKYQISQYSTLSKWKEWWRKVETGLFESPSEPIRKKALKMVPEVGTDVIVRVLRQDEQNRFYCRIEDDSYYGEGWLDVYGKGASTGLFHYEPFLDLSSFYSDGDPLLLRVRVNAVQNANEETPRFMFDAMGYLDDFVRDNCEYDARYNCKLIYHDTANKVIMGVTEVGFGVFVPEASTETEYGIGDCVTIRLTDTSNGKRIQAEVTGHADEDVDVKTAAESLLLSYSDEQTYQESADELAEEAMSVSEDQFEPAQIRQLIHILDHKSILESNRVKAYGYISIAIVLARMAGDETMIDYLRQRQRMICVLDDFGKNGKVDEDEIRNLSDQNADQIERFPLLKQKLCQIQIVNSMGKQENNEYLWNLVGRYNSGHIIGKLARLMLSYNMADGFGLQSHREEITDQIKSLLNINVKLPKIYSFGEEGQLVEFKSSIVFPPGNGMKADIRTQTFNILKVINGMVNSYGGTLYFGVYDTGTAKGLEDDLPFFDGSQDKFKLYVRNQIRLAMGNAVSAGIVEDTPDAGNHWIYSVKVRPSKEPVAMQFNGMIYYFFREGSSTYLYENLEEVKRVMDDRRLGDYNMSEADMLAESETGTVREVETAETRKPRRKSVGKDTKAIATGMRRRNVIQEWEEDYGVDVCGYFRIKKAGEWCHLDDTGYEDNLITVAINEKERNGSIVLVYEDGEVQRIPVAEVLRKDHGRPDRMRTDKLPVFVCPVKEDSALLVAFDDNDGINYMRMDDISGYPAGRLTDEGRRIIDINMGGVTACEIVDRDSVHKFSKIHNLNRRNLGTRTDHIYEKSLIEAAKEYGVI
ncbi:MAG: ATP-binding protein, partial [Muribaculaceae bacterium]|nr:ATP-binding protein [Muribaculaceae bacterium]